MGLFSKPRMEKRGIKILVYGGTGVGKSWFALTFPRVAVIDTEDGTSMYQDNPNMVQRLVTTSAVDIEDAIVELKDDLINEFDTVVVDSETKMYENLQHSALVVVERRARKSGRDAFSEGLSLKEWGKIKLIHKRINSRLIELAGYGKNVIMITQLSDEKQKMGDEFVKIGEKPNGIKGIEYDFDIVMKIYIDKDTNQRYGVIEKDRTSTYQIGDIVENPSFDNWKHIYDNSQKLESSNINLNKDIDNDSNVFEDDLDTMILNIRTALKDKLKTKTLSNNDIMNVLTKFNIKSLDEIKTVDIAKSLLLEFAIA